MNQPADCSDGSPAEWGEPLEVAGSSSEMDHDASPSEDQANEDEDRDINNGGFEESTENGEQLQLELLTVRCPHCRQGRHELCSRRQESFVSQLANFQISSPAPSDFCSSLSPPTPRFFTSMNKMSNSRRTDSLRLPEWLEDVLASVGPITLAFVYELPSSDDNNKDGRLTPICIPCTAASSGKGRVLRRNSVKYHRVGNSENDWIGATSILSSPNMDNACALPCTCSYISSWIGLKGDKRADGKDLHSSYSSTPSMSKLPVEIWENITEYLDREDVKNMRLANKALERSTSARLFKTVVVPFTAELYKDLEQTELETANYTNWLAKGRQVNVFHGFGQHIRNFGMSFEFDETSLVNPPTKTLDQGHSSYWGRYVWPKTHYTRFKDTANLELAADDTAAMGLAFSQLKSVTHLALSLDAGFGWLSGIDLSLKSKIFRQPTRMFGPSFCPDQSRIPQQKLWRIIQGFHQIFGPLDKLQTLQLGHKHVNPQELYEIANNKPSIQLPLLHLVGPFIHGSEISTAGPISDTASEASSEGNSDDMAIDFFDLNYNGHVYSDSSSEASRIGLVYTKSFGRSSGTSELGGAFNPRNLTKSQTEWLLETAWAQDAFLSSYVLAVVDNRGSFNHVRQLTISKLSSRNLNQITRDDFWTSLRALKDVSINVIADHRQVRKLANGVVDTTWIQPSEAVNEFHALINMHLLRMKSISKLQVGWVDGGEHAEGICARNCQILPTPMTAGSKVLSPDEALNGAVAQLKHVKELTLSNCWVSPLVMEALCSTSNAPVLQKLTLESVSLSVHPVVELQQLRDTTQNMLAVAQQLNAQGPLNPLIEGQAKDLLPHVLLLARRLLNEQGDRGQRIFGRLMQLYDSSLSRQLDLNPELDQPIQRSDPYHHESRGSWPDVLDKLKIGRESAGHGLSLTCRSCGYVRLPNFKVLPQLRMLAGELEYYFSTPDASTPLDWRFFVRRGHLQGMTMRDDDKFHGEIAAALTAAEMLELKDKWGLHEGWPATDTTSRYGAGKWGPEGRDAAVFDGAHPGMGRFSGTITKLG